MNMKIKYNLQNKQAVKDGKKFKCFHCKRFCGFYNKSLAYKDKNVCKMCASKILKNGFSPKEIRELKKYSEQELKEQELNDKRMINEFIAKRNNCV